MKKTHKHIVIGVLSAEGYTARRAACRRTWMADLVRLEAIRAVFVVGKADATRAYVDGDVLYVPCADGYQSLPRKTYLFIAWALENHEFDCIMKCDDDTYVSIARLMSIDLAGKDYVGSDCDGFAQGGAGYLLSPLSARIIRENMSGIHQGLEDDSVGRVLGKCGIRLCSDARFRPSCAAGDRPSRENSIVTAHECGAKEMDEIHSNLTASGQTPLTAVGNTSPEDCPSPRKWENEMDRRVPANAARPGSTTTAVSRPNAPRRLVRVGRRVARVPEPVVARRRDLPKRAAEDMPHRIGQRSNFKHTIALIGIYSGPLPAWIDNYIETCKYNPSVTWFLFFDGGVPRNRAPNVHVAGLTLDKLSRRIEDRLGVPAAIKYGYKVCDVKPMFGELFSDQLREFDFWGHCDFDIVWGDLRAFLTPERLKDFDVISTCPGGLCGPLTLFRNNPFINGLYRRGDYRRALTNTKHQAFDEVGCSPVVARANEQGELRLLNIAVHEYDGYHREAGTGEGACYWRGGKLFCTPEQRELMYFHFAGTKRWSWPDIWIQSGDIK